jgi:hypothetical protein
MTPEADFRVTPLLSSLGLSIIVLSSILSL